MQTVNIHDAQAHFSRLVDAAANGEENIEEVFVIAHQPGLEEDGLDDVDV